MAHRAESGTVGGPLEGFYRGVLKAINALTGRVKKLEGIVAGGTAPADTRFEGQLDEDDVLHVYLRRISTDTVQEVGVSPTVLAALAADAAEATPKPIDGIDGLAGLDGLDGRDAPPFLPDVIDGGIP